LNFLGFSLIFDGFLVIYGRFLKLGVMVKMQEEEHDQKRERRGLEISRKMHSLFQKLYTQIEKCHRQTFLIPIKIHTDHSYSNYSWN